jgi:hypothetical protein
MSTTRPSLRPGAVGPVSAETKPGFDARDLALASVSSVMGGIVASAFGGGPLATLVCAAISPWITAFLTHPGPHRVRRVVAVLLFAWLVAGCRKALAAVRTAAHLPRAKTRDRRSDLGAPTSVGGRTVGSAQARLTRAWLAQVTLIAAISFTVAVVLLTTVEAIRGQALAAQRDTTFLGGEASPAGPTVLVPNRVVAQAGDHSATRVTYRVTATNAAGNPLTPVCDPPSGALFTVGETRVTCSATDVAGEQAREQFLVIVRPGGTPQRSDRRQPVLTVPDNFTHDATTALGARVTYAATAHDARDAALTPDCLPPSGSFFALGRTRIACKATDAAGNTAHASFTVTVIRAGDADNTPPVISVPDAIQAPATSKGATSVTYHVSVTDNRDGTLKASCDPPSGSVFKLGKTTVRCSAQDSAHNKAEQTFKVTVVHPRDADLTPPVLAVPDPIKTTATSKGGTRVTYRVSARDNRDGRLKPRCDPRSGSLFAIGLTTVICSAHDSAGNQDTKTFTVTVTAVHAPPSNGGSGAAPPPKSVSDATPPVIRVPAAITTRATSADGASVTYDVSATDDRDGALKATCEPPSRSDFKIGTTTVTCSAQDAAGNTATKTFKITVVDDTPPVISVPAAIQTRATSAEGASVTYDVSASDNHDGALKATCEPPSGSVFKIGTTTVTCSAQDAAGNAAHKSFTITVTPPPPPPPPPGPQ